MTTLNIKNRPYCTHDCLRSLVEGGDLDPRCPNHSFHGPKHITKRDFLRAVKQQLLIDTGSDASCMPLHPHGARGGLLKICLYAYGYTFVAKGSEKHNRKHLLNERQVYRQLTAVQGIHVPVCLGLLELQDAYHYSGARLSHLLLMSWGGRPLAASLNTEFQSSFPELAEEAMIAIHRLKVRHNDAEPRNMVFDSNSMTLMFVDFERSTSMSRPALVPKCVNNGQTQAAKTQLPCHKSFGEELLAIRNHMRPYTQSRIAPSQ